MCVDNDVSRLLTEIDRLKAALAERDREVEEKIKIITHVVELHRQSISQVEQRERQIEKLKAEREWMSYDND